MSSLPFTVLQYQSGNAGLVPACAGRCNDTSQYNYVTAFQFVGGYYGAATEAAMQAEMYANGPISVEFMVYPDFMHYAGGVYSHTAAASAHELQINPWEASIHAPVAHLF